MFDFRGKTGDISDGESVKFALCFSDEVDDRLRSADYRCSACCQVVKCREIYSETAAVSVREADSQRRMA